MKKGEKKQHKNKNKEKKCKCNIKKHNIKDKKDNKIINIDTNINVNYFHKCECNKIGVPLINSGPIGYTPAQIRKAYGLTNITQDGTGQIIGIIDAYYCPTALADFQTFDKQFGINKSQNIKIASYTTVTNQGWALESLLDIQWAHALAPGATILLVQARSNSINDLLTAVDYATNNGATIISMSWGANEFPSESFFDTHFNKTNVVYIASSGDAGGIVIWPSAAPSVLSVGGTTLKLDTQGNRIGTLAETGWNGSGGGKSAYETIPFYQTSFGLIGKRQTPDISFDADPNTGVAVYDSFGLNGQKGWFKVGGTSLSAPCLAGIIAIANQSRLSINKKPLTNVTLLYYLYNVLGKGINYLNDFYDILIGNAGQNTAKLRYDNVTGLGSPKNTSIQNGLVYGLINQIP